MRFFLDPVSSFAASYADLVDDVSCPDELQGAWLDLAISNQIGTKTATTSSSYSFIVQLLRGLLLHQPRIELRTLTGSLPPQAPSAQRTFTTSLLESNDGRSHLENWRQKLFDSPSQILLETSGSTGEPQTVWHTIASLTRGVRLGDDQRQSVWGLAYPLDHLAGLQVLFQALLNFNPLIQLYRVDPSSIHQAIDQHQITHLSCTPTFLRMLLAADGVHPSLRRLTNGGERYDRELDRRIRVMFPHATRRNIYASTEVGPLLVSDNDRFRIPDHLLPLLQIIDGELWLHQSLRVDKEACTTEIDVQKQAIHASFFPSGDQVEIVDEQPLTIRFLSRKTEGFNVAGFRVDPHRLESIARQYPEIANARFYGIANSVTEHVVACDLVLNGASTSYPIRSTDASPTETRDQGSPPVSLNEVPFRWSESQFRTWFAERVQRHEQPRIIRIVSELPTTPSGKVNRKSEI